MTFMDIAVFIFDFIVTVTLVVLTATIVYYSHIMIEEKKERRRNGLTDYYDNPIHKDEKSEKDL
jgi:hypothetical protein